MKIKNRIAVLQGTVFVLGLFLQLCDGESVCKSVTTSNTGSTTTYTKCSGKCCGDVNAQYCCESSTNGLVIGVVATSIVFIILAIGLAICCMKNHSRKTTRVAVLQITENQNAAIRRDERRERRQREAAAAMAGYPQPNMAGYPDVPPPAYMVYGDNQPPGAYAEPLTLAHPPPAYSSNSYDASNAPSGLDHISRHY